MRERTVHIDCVCGSAEHILRFMYDEDEKEVYTDVQLRQYRNVFKRVWVALKYVCGYTSRYGVWDCTLLEKEGIEVLHAFLTKALEAIRKQEDTDRGKK